MCSFNIALGLYKNQFKKIRYNEITLRDLHLFKLDNLLQNLIPVILLVNNMPAGLAM
jgi:hypothetical protein